MRLVQCPLTTECLHIDDMITHIQSVGSIQDIKFNISASFFMGEIIVHIKCENTFIVAKYYAINNLEIQMHEVNVSVFTDIERNNPIDKTIQIIKDTLDSLHKQNMNRRKISEEYL